eukprot:1578967-Prymnesium_polylepis.1
MRGLVYSPNNTAQRAPASARINLHSQARMYADAISGADAQGDGADTSHIVRNGAYNSWILVVPPEQPTAGAADLTDRAIE